MATLAQGLTEAPPAEGWLWDFLKYEMAPYPGRIATVGRMVLASTLVMIISETYRIPSPFQGAVFALLVSRESPQATVRSAGTIILVTFVSVAYLLVGAWFVISFPWLHFLWNIFSFFLVLLHDRHAHQLRRGYCIRLHNCRRDSVVGHPGTGGEECRTHTLASGRADRCCSNACSGIGVCANRRWKRDRPTHHREAGCRPECTAFLCGWPRSRSRYQREYPPDALGIAAIRLLARLTREPSSSDMPAAIQRIRQLAETINAQMDKVRSAADGVLFEFGPSRQQDLALRDRIRRRQPRLRTLFLMRRAVLRYSLRLPGFELPEAALIVLHEYNDRSSRMLDNMADRIDGRERGIATETEDTARLLEQVCSECGEQPLEQLPPHLRSFVLLLRRIDSLTRLCVDFSPSG
jgi:hypothetical protein